MRFAGLPFGCQEAQGDAAGAGVGVGLGVAGGMVGAVGRMVGGTVTTASPTTGTPPGERKIAEIRNILYKDAVKVVLKTRDKIRDFRKPDGGFSYLKNRSSELSQSMPVTLPNMPESDVNATIISGPQLINFSMDVLGLKHRPPIFGRAEYERYIAILEENRKKAGV